MSVDSNPFHPGERVKVRHDPEDGPQDEIVGVIVCCWWDPCFMTWDNYIAIFNRGFPSHDGGKPDLPTIERYFATSLVPA